MHKDKYNNTTPPNTLELFLANIALGYIIVTREILVRLLQQSAKVEGNIMFICTSTVGKYHIIPIDVEALGMENGELIIYRDIDKLKIRKFDLEEQGVKFQKIDSI